MAKKEKQPPMKEISKVAMNIPDDATMVNNIDSLPECFRQFDNYYFKKNMPHGPNGELNIWYQNISAEALSRALAVKEYKAEFEAKYGRLLL